MFEKSRKTILLVEDEALVAAFEKNQLEGEGYNIVTALSGEEAVDIAGRTREELDLILMDINLGPGIDGTEAASRILARHEIPVVFLSSHTSKDVVEKTEKITSYGYVVKNSGITVLDASIKMAFKLFDAHRRAEENEDRLRHTIDNMLEGYQIIGRDWRYLYVNDAVARHGRYKKDEYLGRTMMELYPGFEKTETFALLKDCMENRASHQLENAFTYPDGSKGWFRLSIEPAPEGIVVLSEDITEAMSYRMKNF